MKKSLLFLILTISFLLPSCGSSGENQPSQSPQQSFGEERIEFTDALGQAFSLPRPKRVVAIIGSFADIWRGEKIFWSAPPMTLGNPLVWSLGIM